MFAALITILWLLFFHLTIGVGVNGLMFACIGYVCLAFICYAWEIP